MTKSPVTVAIDGLAATGKGTIARRLSGDLDFAYLDTGLLYRVVGVSVIKDGADLDDEVFAIQKAKDLDPENLNKLAEDPMVRTDQGSRAASKVAAIQGVREALLQFQKDFVTSPPEGKPGAVLDGRDIGTVIAPEAKVKIFVEASPEIRASRRFKELQERGENVTEAAVLEDMKERDMRDASRPAAPAVPAEDAVHLDTSELDPDEAYKAALEIVRQKLEG